MLITTDVRTCSAASKMAEVRMEFSHYYSKTYGVFLQKVHEYKVGMTCDGCSSAVQRVLDRLKGETQIIS